MHLECAPTDAPISLITTSSTVLHPNRSTIELLELYEQFFRENSIGDAPR